MVSLKPWRQRIGEEHLRGARSLPAVSRFAFGMPARLDECVDQRVGFVFEVTDITFAKGDRLPPFDPFRAGHVRIVGTVKPIVFIELGFAAAEFLIRRLRTQKPSRFHRHLQWPPAHGGSRWKHGSPGCCRHQSVRETREALRLQILLEHKLQKSSNYVFAPSRRCSDTTTSSAFGGVARNRDHCSNNLRRFTMTSPLR